MKKLTKIMFTIIVVALFLGVVSIPFMNNYVAYSVKKELTRVSLPDKTELVDSISSAGKLVGNGNGMQFFGAILIKSELALEELDHYFSK
ncbi:hypothetical protein AB4Z21_37950, partial [Paenibacillus sp. MCAF20]